MFYWYFATFFALALAMVPIEEHFEMDVMEMEEMQLNASNVLYFGIKKTTVVHFFIASNETVEFSVSHCNASFINGTMKVGNILMETEWLKFSANNECEQDGKYMIAIIIKAVDGAAHGVVGLSNDTTRDDLPFILFLLSLVLFVVLFLFFLCFRTSSIRPIHSPPLYHDDPEIYGIHLNNFRNRPLMYQL